MGVPLPRPDIRIDGATAYLPLPGKGGIMRGWVAIDQADLPLVSDRPWCLSASGYAFSSRGRGRGSDYLHRIIMPGGALVDHIDGDKLNCRRSNLRRCSHRENMRNTALRATNTTGFKGVSLCRKSGKYLATIMVDGRTHYLGLHTSAEAAALAYDTACIQHFGEFARPNISISLASGPGVLSEAA